MKEIKEHSAKAAKLGIIDDNGDEWSCEFLFPAQTSFWRKVIDTLAIIVMEFIR